MGDALGLMAGSQPIAEDRLVTLANWQDPPGNRWAFQHVRELVPTAAIRRGRGPAWNLDRDEHDVLTIPFQSGDQDWKVEELLASSETDAFLVLHRGRIVAEHYFNGMTEGSTHLLQSVSKSLTGALAGCLIGSGLLRADARVDEIVSELGSTSFAGATVQQLLDMRSGTRFDEDYDNPTADVRVSEQVYLLRPRTIDHLPSDALAYFATLVNDDEHGGEFRYRSILTDVLAWVIERAGGGRFHELLSRELWEPMGAEFDAEVCVDGHGNAMADGGICTSLRDLGRVGLLYLNGGRRDRVPVVPGTWVTDTIQGTPESRSAFASSATALGYPGGAHYRNYWWVHDSSAPLLYAAGIYGQHLFVHGPSQTVVAKFSTWPTPLDEVKQAATRDATVAIGTHLNERTNAASL